MVAGRPVDPPIASGSSRRRRQSAISSTMRFATDSMTLRPNWARRPAIARSVEIVTSDPLSAAVTCMVAVALTRPAPTPSVPSASTVAWRATGSCDVMDAWPRYVTPIGPTLTRSVPTKVSGPCSSIADTPGMQLAILLTSSRNSYVASGSAETSNGVRAARLAPARGGHGHRVRSSRRPDQAEDLIGEKRHRVDPDAEGVRASSMASAMTAETGMTPASPVPLTPSGLSGDGVSM